MTKGNTQNGSTTLIEMRRFTMIKNGHDRENNYVINGYGMPPFRRLALSTDIGRDWSYLWNK